MHVAKNFHDLAFKPALSGDGRREFLADDPSLELLPVFGVDGPAIVFCPFTFFRRVPITIVFFSQAALLPDNPLAIFASALPPNLHQGRSLFSSVDAEAGCDCLG
jgi:hypothetical protein